MKLKKLNVTHIFYSMLLTSAVLLTVSCTAERSGEPPHSSRYITADTLQATTYDTGFDEGGISWNSISTASDGKVYYSLSTTDIDQGAQFYSFDPGTDQIELVADFTEVVGDGDRKVVPQGKSHGNFYEMDGKLYIATHVGVHGSIEGGELAISEEGYDPYPGGHFLSYDLSTGEFEDLAQAPSGQGILTFVMDRDRGDLYGITWPLGYFIHYDPDTGSLDNLGLISGRGEAGTPGDDFRTLCRSMFVDPADGSVYFTTADGDIFSYNPESDSITQVEGVNLRLDYFGTYDTDQPGNYGYNWRQIVWNPVEEAAYGVHAKSGYLFRFDPREPKLEVVTRLVPGPLMKTGNFIQHYYGYLGFDLGPDQRTLYYITGGPLYIDGELVTEDNREEFGLDITEVMHLVTYNIPNRRYMDHGPVFSNGSPISNAHSIAIRQDAVYTLGSIDREGEREVDLVEIPNPLSD